MGVSGRLYCEQGSNICSNTSRIGSRGLVREARRAEVDSTPASVRRTLPASEREGERQMRRIGEPVEPLANGGSPPLVFRWQGRRYVVGTVLAHWVETGAWWRVPSSARGTRGCVLDPERQMWRVEVCRGKSTGVFDLCQDATGWSLRGVLD